MKKLFMIGLGALLFITACQKEDTTPSNPINPNNKGYITLEYDNRVGDLGLVLDSPFYTNALGQNFSITKFNYFISNIVLLNEDGSTYVVPQDSSYFLVQESDAETQEIMIRVPEGNYSGVKFVVGIDSLRNTKPLNERTGTLDPAGTAAGMYWTWNSGYIFLKMEGNYNDPNDTVLTRQDYLYHIGGFGGFSSPTINNIKNINMSFGTDRAEVRQSKGIAGPNVHMYVDAGKVLSNGTNVNFNENPMVMFAPYSTSIANNYAGMFSVNHVHND